jgi:16S rRNA pseudouridine516 synthase
MQVGQKATAAEVLLDGEPLDPPAPLVVLLHKPVGYVVTSPDDENVLDPKIYDLLPYR